MSLVHLSTLADSAVFCMETSTSHHDRISMLCCLRHQLLHYMSHSFPCTSYRCLPRCNGNFCRTNRHATFMSLRTFITHTFSFFRLFNSPVDNVSLWCNTNRKLSLTLSPHSNKMTTRRVKSTNNSRSFS
jgi:hypothetical protein